MRGFSEGGTGGAASPEPATALVGSWRPRAGGILGMAKPVDPGSAARLPTPGAGPGGQACGRTGNELAAQCLGILGWQGQ